MREVDIRFHRMTSEALWPHEVGQSFESDLSLFTTRYGVADTREERDLQLGAYSVSTRDQNWLLKVDRVDTVESSEGAEASDDIGVDG